MCIYFSFPSQVEEVILDDKKADQPDINTITEHLLKKTDDRLKPDVSKIVEEQLQNTEERLKLYIDKRLTDLEERLNNKLDTILTCLLHKDNMKPP